MPDHAAERCVVVVDDDPAVAELFAAWLREAYETRMACGGRAALRLIDDSVDVVVLDRQMPGLSGEEVVAELRARGLNCRVVMTTAVEPDFDILELGIHEYLHKPVSRCELVEAVEWLARLDEYDELVVECYELASKKAVLEGAKSRGELEDSGAFEALVMELEKKLDRIDGRLANLGGDRWEGLYRDAFARGGGSGCSEGREG